MTTTHICSRWTANKESLPKMAVSSVVLSMAHTLVIQARATYASTQEILQKPTMLARKVPPAVTTLLLLMLQATIF